MCSDCVNSSFFINIDEITKCTLLRDEKKLLSSLKNTLIFDVHPVHLQREITMNLKMLSSTAEKYNCVSSSVLPETFPFGTALRSR